MARSDDPFEVIEKVGSNASKLQLPGDMVVSVTFNIGELSSYVGDSLKEPLDWRSNPCEEGEFNVGTYPQETLDDGKDQEDQAASQS